VSLGPGDRVEAGIESLDEDPSRFCAASAPSRYLGQDLEGPFGGPEIRKVQRGVGGDDADQRDIGEIMTLGDHLGADEDIDPAAVEVPEYPFHVSPSGGCIAVHPGDAGIRKALLHLHFDPFRSRPVTPETAAPAFGTADSGLCRVVAVVAFQEVFGSMEGEGDVAVRAGKSVTAVRTEEESMESPAIKKEKGLLSPFQGFTDRVDQGA
jgi:hypothetical protein